MESINCTIFLEIEDCLKNLCFPCNFYVPECLECTGITQNVSCTLYEPLYLTCSLPIYYKFPYSEICLRCDEIYKNC